MNKSVCINDFCKSVSIPNLYYIDLPELDRVKNDNIGKRTKNLIGAELLEETLSVISKYKSNLFMMDMDGHKFQPGEDFQSYLKKENLIILGVLGKYLDKIKSTLLIQSKEFITVRFDQTYIIATSRSWNELINSCYEIGELIH